jgi:UDP-N-acetylglucosamine transferase subunit ALG13
MILVAVGASQFPFDRLLRAVDELPRAEPLVVQHGPSAIRPVDARCLQFVPLHDLAELVREARIVVTHAGVGSILLALTNGKRPFVVPRLRAFGETVDDHQLESARRFAQAGLVHLVEDPRQLGAALTATGDDAYEKIAAPEGELQLVRELRAYLGQTIDAPGAVR